MANRAKTKEADLLKILKEHPKCIDDPEYMFATVWTKEMGVSKEDFPRYQQMWLKLLYNLTPADTISKYKRNVMDALLKSKAQSTKQERDLFKGFDKKYLQGGLNFLLDKIEGRV